MRIWQRILCASLSLLTLGSAGCGVGIATAGAAVIYYKTQEDQSATVELKAKPEAVYQAAIAAAGKNPALTIVKRDDGKRELEVSNGEKNTTFKITELATGGTKLVVSSDTVKEGESGADGALQAVKRGCDETSVEYKIVEE